MGVPHARQEIVLKKAVLGLIVPPVAFWSTGHRVGAIFSVLPVFITVGIIIVLGDISLGVILLGASWFFIGIGAAGTWIETEQTELEIPPPPPPVIPRGRQIGARKKAVLGALVPPVGFWSVGQPASAIVSFLI